MSSFPKSPRLTKGALISYEVWGLIPQVVIFQYNPETMTRSVRPRRPQYPGDPLEVQRLMGPPAENIQLEVELDAADQLEKQDARAVELGIYPQLSALEMMLYPKSTWVIYKTGLAAAGGREIAPPEQPFTLFVWGVKRVVPVRITGISVEEQYYDPNLNPIAAEVSLTLDVLNYDDFKLTHPGYWTFLIHQMTKEAMAAVGSGRNTRSLGNVEIL